MHSIICVSLFLLYLSFNFYIKKIDRKNNTNAEFTVFVLFSLGWGREIFLLIFAKQNLKVKPMLCKYLRSSLKTVRRTVFSPDGVALSSNLSSTASQVKQKEQAEACSFCLAGHKELRLNARFLYFCYKGVAGIVFETCKPLKSTVYLIPAITEVLKAGESLLIELSIFSWRNPKRFLKGPVKVAHT